MPRCTERGWGVGGGRKRKREGGEGRERIVGRRRETKEGGQEAVKARQGERLAEERVEATTGISFPWFPPVPPGSPWVPLGLR